MHTLSNLNLISGFSYTYDSNEVNTLNDLFNLTNITITENEFLSSVFIFDILSGNNEISSFIISDLNKQIILENSSQYIFNLYKFKHFNEDEINIIKKYPEGTYNISINEIIDKILLKFELNKYDLLNFDTKNGKLNSLINIIIPDDVNPINFYFMIAHYKAIIFIDYITDNIFIFQNSILESFLSLHIPSTPPPKSIKTNENYDIFELDIYEFIDESYKNENNIKNNLKKLGQFNNNELNIDDYKLYYWIENFKVKITNKIKNFLDSIFKSLNISIIGYCIDDLDNQKFSNDTLDFILSSCIYSFNNNNIDYYKQNSIIWQQTSDWENLNNESINKLKISVSGNDVIRVSKQRFKKITGINLDIESVISGELTSEQFKLLYLNQPQIYAFERLQNILSIRYI